MILIIVLIVEQLLYAIFFSLSIFANKTIISSCRKEQVNRKIKLFIQFSLINFNHIGMGIQKSCLSFSFTRKFT